MREFGALFNLHCVGCGQWGFTLCPPCLDRAVGAPVHASIDGVPVVAVGHYSGPLKAVIRAAKFGRSHEVLDDLAPVVERLAGRFPDTTAIPIPSSPMGFAARGFHVSRRIARFTGLRIAPVLTLDARPSQHARSRSQRLTNRTARVTRARFTDIRRVILIDDVVTTGSTIRAGINACRAKGMTVVGVVALAVTPLRGSTPELLPKSAWRD